MKKIGKFLKISEGQSFPAFRSTSTAGVMALLMASAMPGATRAAEANDIKPCATIKSTEAAGDKRLVAPREQDLVIVIRPAEPKVGRPVVAWIAGHQPGHLLVARRISWSFNNAASMLKDSGGGSASTIYLTPGKKKISVSVTDMSGKRKKATCSLDVTW